jgi:D-tyrosyl-tRNA(Tyr) deacylase
MVCVIQRVNEANVSVDGSVIGKCGNGLLLLVCAVKGDTETVAVKMAEKVLKMRIFEDGEGKMNLSVADVGGSCLAVSNFTLAASCRRGTRPDFFAAERPPLAKDLYELFVKTVKDGGIPTETGEFGADMKIHTELDGPVTIILDSEKDLAH